MSKGSLFFGRATGKLGQIVLSNVKGQQIARAWQPKVANPRTSVQQVQRAKFANAVKFYKRATQNLFKFAYEDKRKTESDYNAFMRHNVAESLVIDRTSYDNLNYPALGRWILSSGSMGLMQCVDYDSRTITNACALNAPNGGTDSAFQFPEGTTENTATIANVSDYFKYNFGAQEGDFITFVGINTEIKKVNDQPKAGPFWSITQMKIDSADTHLFLETMNKQAVNSLGMDFVEREGVIIWKSPQSKVVIFGVVLSRVTSNGVLVSTSIMGINQTGQLVVRDILGDTYSQQALNSWSRSSDPILKGSVVMKSNV